MLILLPINLAAKLHDIGKINVSGAILPKSGKITENGIFPEAKIITVADETIVKNCVELFEKDKFKIPSFKSYNF